MTPTGEHLCYTFLEVENFHNIILKEGRDVFKLLQTQFVNRGIQVLCSLHQRPGNMVSLPKWDSILDEVVGYICCKHVWSQRQNHLLADERRTKGKF